MDDKKERGAVIVEATISLPVYIFAIFIILSIVNICYIQARIGNALNASAKEISQYTYLYYKFGGDKADAKSKEGTEESRKLSEKTIDGLVDVMDSLSGAKKSADSGAFDDMTAKLNNSKGNVDDLCNDYADNISKDPKQFVFGFAKLAFGELKEETKALLGATMAKAFMKKNLVASENDDSDSFLKRYRVVNGMKGLDFSYTSLMPYGETDKILLVCSYEVSVLKLLNIDFKFNFQNIARTRSWGNGIAKSRGKTPFSLGDWTSLGGKKIVVSAFIVNGVYHSAIVVFPKDSKLKEKHGYHEKEMQIEPGTICYDRTKNDDDKYIPDASKPILWTGEEFINMTREGNLYVVEYEGEKVAYNGPSWVSWNGEEWVPWFKRDWLGFSDNSIKYVDD